MTLDGNQGAVYAGAVHTAIAPLVDLQDRLKHLRAAQGKVSKVHKTSKPTKEVAS